jgi:hypothetical protein
MLGIYRCGKKKEKCIRNGERLEENLIKAGSSSPPRERIWMNNLQGFAAQELLTTSKTLGFYFLFIVLERIHRGTLGWKSLAALPQ